MEVKLDRDLFKEIAEVSTHPWRDYTDCIRDKLNRKIRKEIEKELNKPPSPRDLEIKQILEEEKRKWESDKAEFEANPVHWSNNKRRRFGMSTLRGSLNKNRITKFHSFKPTPRVFFAIEDIIEELLSQKIDENFNQFVDVKNMSFGDSNTYYI